jgi:uncharacterized protein (TIGR02145 family)
MAENLKTTKYNDGTDIPGVTGLTEWINLVTPGYCWYLNNTKYENTCGALYNWYTVNTGKLCPSGWHIPGNQEWVTLDDYLGGETVAADQLREADTSHWVYTCAQVTNSSGFTAMPGGYRLYKTGRQRYFGDLGYQADFWTSDEPGDVFNAAYYWSIVCYSIFGEGFVSHGGIPKESGLSVRCVKD